MWPKKQVISFRMVLGVKERRWRYNNKLIAGALCEPFLASPANVNYRLDIGGPAGLCFQIRDYFIHRAHNVDHGAIFSISRENLTCCRGFNNTPVKTNDMTGRELCERLLESFEFQPFR
jgi:hypothetical protein